MTNSLRKTTRTTIIPERAAQAAIPYRPARAAYSTTTTERVCYINEVFSGRTLESYDFLRDGQGRYVKGPDGLIRVEYTPPSPGTLTRTRVCMDQVTITNYPAQPEQLAQPGVAYRPQTVVQDFGLGWNAGARSIGNIAGNGSAQFKIPQAVGAVVGFNDRDDSTAYEEIDHGFYAAGRSLRVYESGVEKFNAGNFAPTDTLKIERLGTRVRYYKNGLLLYTSTTPSTGPIFLDASLYSGGDTVADPLLIETAAGGGAWLASMLPMGGFWADGDYSVFRGELLPLGGTFSALKTRFAGRMLPLTGMLTNKRYGGFAGRFAEVTGQLTAGALAPPYSLFTAQMFPPVGYMQGLTGGLFTSTTPLMYPTTGMWTDKVYGEFTDATMFPMVGFWADAAYLQPAQPLPRMQLNLSAGSTVAMTAPKARLSVKAERSTDGVTMLAPASTLQIATGADASMSAGAATLAIEATAQEFAHFVLSSPAAALSVQAQTEVLAQVLLTGPSSTLSAATGGGMAMTGPATALAAQATVEVLARFTLAGPSATLNVTATTTGLNEIEMTGPALVAGSWATAVLTMPLARLRVEASTPTTVVHEAYAVNLRSDLEGGGNEVTRYTNFPFDRIVRWRGSYYGMAADGLYLLEGNTDDGAPIEWALRTGTTDFNKPEKKNTASAYVGGRLGPATTFTVFTGEKSENQYAYTTPRGATAQNYRQKFGRGLDARYYAFQMEGDGELEMDDLTFEVVPRTRRI